MNKSNVSLWCNLEKMVELYAKETEIYKKETILSNVFEEMKSYISKCINNAYLKPRNYGLEIPKEDFESRFMQNLWEAVESFQVGGSTFKNIVIRRFDFAEKHTWNQYKTKGNKDDKDGVSYESARLESLDRKIGGSESEEETTLANLLNWKVVSTEDKFLDQIEEASIISEFARVNERYANVIRFMALGYKGDALAIATGEADSNNPKFRKLIQRSKDSFAKFMNERSSL